MCTLTFAPNQHGFLAGMNRDELLTRPAALPPKVLTFGDSKAISPSEPDGGTWIACNRFGNLLAILNWRCIDPVLLAEKTMSRGFVIPKLIGAGDRLSAANQFNDLQLAGCLPFRLVGIFPGESAVHEWSWDGVRKGEFAHPWARRNWFSSSLSDIAAQERRGAVCDAAWNLESAGTESWIRTLHRSHMPERGPFSICVHRSDAATVSYTEVSCSTDAISMRYIDGSPCTHQFSPCVTEIHR